MAKVNTADLKLAKNDLIERGSKDPTPLGSAIFVGFRFLDPLWQYQLLAYGTGNALITRLGGTVIPPGIAVHTGISSIDSLGLSPHRLVLLGMGIGAMLKQNHWQLFLSGEPMPVPAALMVGTFNIFLDTLSTIFFLNRFTSTAQAGETTLSAKVVVGGALYVLGLALEWYSEIQRKAFKANPKNEGKAYTGGLWSLARHINYAGYALWRTGFAMASGGLAWGAVIAALNMSVFIGSSIPILDEYCDKRYGEQWAAFKRQTPYKLFPYIL
ncbi:hypothetical protein EJ05DRAFT_479127 [Pseudovirgaria hyperparasitica]|uniref:Steroid 5-alpha reductase C-terminal domain-containing protein n=1 Tax=Pseudovirgaria hyperparasitica TaxID=470096 RepID=A0A6A6VZE4_9PEZI|nr:uncharacterized protein EJ05DRAFT_479127 [Pseudovirgaria hyperparasitica]KAF2754687.1 hypothetical protein EJ05DRAFT_479127 [Pseudovirgaria hyperparasitica]